MRATCAPRVRTASGSFTPTGRRGGQPRRAGGTRARVVLVVLLTARERERERERERDVHLEVPSVVSSYLVCLSSSRVGQTLLFPLSLGKPPSPALLDSDAFAAPLAAGADAAIIVEERVVRALRGVRAGSFLDQRPLRFRLGMKYSHHFGGRKFWKIVRSDRSLLWTSH